MAGPIEDYTIVGDMQSVAPISTDGSADTPKNTGVDLNTRGMSGGACQVKSIHAARL